MLSDNLEGWDGGGGEREAQEAAQPTADSHCCTAATNNIVKQLYSN